MGQQNSYLKVIVVHEMHGELLQCICMYVHNVYVKVLLPKEYKINMFRVKGIVSRYKRGLAVIATIFRYVVYGEP